MHPKTHRVEARGGHCCTDLGLAQWVANAELGRAIRHHPLMVLETRARFVLPKLMAQQALNPPKNVGGVRQGGWVCVWVLSPSKKGLAASSGMVQLGACGPGQPAVCLCCWLAPLISFFPPAFRSPGDGCRPPPLRLL